MAARESTHEDAPVTKQGSTPSFSRKPAPSGKQVLGGLEKRGLTEQEAVAAITGRPAETPRHEQVAGDAAADRAEQDERRQAAEASVLEMLNEEDPEAGQGSNEIDLPIDEGYDEDADEDLDEDEELDDDELDDDDDETAEEQRQRLEDMLEEAGIDADEVTVRVKVDGEDREISLQQAINDYSGQAASTQRFQEAAALRKAAEAELQGIAAVQQDYTQRLAQMGAMAENFANDPQMQQALQVLESEYQRVSKEQQALTSAMRQRHLQQEAQRIPELIPEWSDPAERKSDRKLIDSYAAEVGMTPDELSQLADARAIRILRDAARYRGLEAKQEQVKEKVMKKASKARQITPSARKPTNARTGSKKALREAEQRMRSSRGRAQEEAAMEVIQRSGLL